MSERLGNAFDEALVYAAEAHRTQKRKSTEIPYVGHLLGVASIVIDNGGDQDEAIAALLHDAPEDQGGQKRLDDIRARFGDRVASIVEACSDSLSEDPDAKADWPTRKRAYLGHLATNKDASVFLVSAADKLHNLRSMVADYAVVGEELWSRFNPAAGKVGSIRYYRSLASSYATVSDPRVSRVAAELRATLDRLERGCGATTDPALSDGAGLINEATNRDARSAIS
ncbi:MAG TPA: HD domain-containing protein [Candidatus Acidoferrales bacterium]|nr:HD domain-containing protein [Candidatus Acidoferrales bacterium]